MTAPFTAFADREQRLLERVGELAAGCAAEASSHDEGAETNVAALDALHAAGNREPGTSTGSRSSPPGA